MNEQPFLGPDHRHGEPGDSGGTSGGLRLLLPVLCCGGPFIVAALATAGALAKGLVVALVTAAISATIIVAWRGRARARDSCCEPSVAQHHPSESSR